MERKKSKSRSPSKSKSKVPSPPPSRVIHLEYFDPAAGSVWIAGTFNDWHPKTTEMIALEPGRWVKEFTLPPGEYEYRLVVDGVWKEDPGCPDSMPNPYGAHNSLLHVQ